MKIFVGIVAALAIIPFAFVLPIVPFLLLVALCAVKGAASYATHKHNREVAESMAAHYGYSPYGYGHQQQNTDYRR